MRLAACALSTVLLSGCSWFGIGGHGEVYGYDNYGYGYAPSAYGYYDGCGTTVVVQSYGCGPGGYGMTQTTYQAGHGYGYTTDVYGGATTIAAAAPYGTAVDTVYGGAAYVGAAQGAYGADVCCGHGVAYGAGGGGKLSLEAAIGTEVALGGDIFKGKASEPFLGGPGTVSDLEAVSYADAFGNTTTYDLTAAYKLNPATTLLGQVGYSVAKGGDQVKVGTVDNGAGTTEDLFAEFSDLKQFRIEGGVRHYLGGGYRNRGLRPYVGATAGFTNVRDVELTQSSETLVDPALFTQTYVDGGWHPSASGVIGADWYVGNNTSFGVETGFRWRDDVDSNLLSEDQWTVPLKLRGRMTF